LPIFTKNKVENNKTPTDYSKRQLKFNVQLKKQEMANLNNRKLMNKCIIFDGEDQYNIFNLEEKEFKYFQIGKN